MTDRINPVEKLEQTNHVERLERIIEQLADSVLELPDEELLAEITESGLDPQQEADLTRFLLRQVVRQPEVENKRLSSRRDTRNSNYWHTPKEGRSR
jgi:hypothetical protein